MVWGGLLGVKNMFFWLVLDASTEFRVDRFPVVTFSTSPQKVTVNPQPSRCWQSLFSTFITGKSIDPPLKHVFHCREQWKRFLGARETFSALFVTCIHQEIPLIKLQKQDGSEFL